MRAHTLPSRDSVLAPNELGWVSYRVASVSASYRIVVEVGISDGNVEMEEAGVKDVMQKAEGTLEAKTRKEGKSLN
jgi:hypothetical protein